MIIKMACESPPRKRAKLSLKFSKNPPTKPMRKLKISSVDEQMKSDVCHTTTTEDGKQRSKTGLTQDGEPKLPLQPYVGFYNIGNTCYLNSVLQALRYCPDFVTTLANVLEVGEKWLNKKSREVVQIDGKDPANGNQEADKEEIDNISRILQLLKEMHKVFEFMRDKEDNFILMPSPDTDMAVNPELVLEALRTVNPMFEGYLQHDAQELLCSLLSSLEEVRERISKEMSCGNKDAMNNNICEVVCRTPTTSKTEGCLKGGCSPSMNRSQKRGVESPSAARKHLSYGPPSGDLVVRNSTVAGVSNEKGDGQRSKEFRRKSMRNKQLECENPKRGENTHDKKDVLKDMKLEKKKSLGIKRLYKLTNQPTIFSKLNILKKKKQHIPPSSPLGDVNKEGDCIGDVKSTDEMEPGLQSPSRDSTMSGAPVVILQHQGISQSLFQGSLVLRTKCMECENYTERCEEFQDISVPVHRLKKEEEDLELNQIEPPTESNDSCDVTLSQGSLDWALSEFTLGERLTDTNKYFCDSCLHLTEAERFLLFDDLPDVMVVHLKRFSALSHTFSPGGSIPKLNDVMVTPLSIRMERWCTKSCQQRMDTYQLMSVVSHTGSSSSSGHYLSYVRVPKLKAVCTKDSESRESPQPMDQYEWVLFDDDQVSTLSEQEFENCINQPSESQELFDTPYLLFYSRVTTEKMTEQI